MRLNIAGYLIDVDGDRINIVTCQNVLNMNSVSMLIFLIALLERMNRHLQPYPHQSLTKIS